MSTKKKIYRMNNRKLFVMGGDAAVMSAASKFRREQPECDITVFERGKHTFYVACGMSDGKKVFFAKQFIIKPKKIISI